MLSDKEPSSLAVTARVGENPRYAGSSHDDDVARQLGFRGALVPGAFIYGYMSRFAVRTWGTTWAEHGRIEARFRRPVYDGDQLLLTASPLRRSDDGLVADVSVRNAAAEEVAVGLVGLPDRFPLPPSLADNPVRPLVGPPPAVGAGELREGTPLTTNNAVLTRDAFETSLRDFGETDPLYREGIVHSGCLMRLAMGDGNGSFTFPTPVIFVAVQAHHFGLAHPGDRLATSGRISAVYERKGQHYFESRELLIANGERPIGLFHRTAIYAMRRTAA
jgi:hypothetical protein